ncbi:hypothetical protein RSAG8_13104, partial [Rhizoctonia solani AG-8 WAC10335]
MNPESLSKDATRKQFARFIEGYNLATLPHPKFYNMASYEHQMNSLRNGMTADVIPSSYDPNADMTAHSSCHRRPTVEADTHLSREQLQELRQVQNERAQARQMKPLGMDIKGTMGVRMDGTEFESVVSRRVDSMCNICFALRQVLCQTFFVKPLTCG